MSLDEVWRVAGASVIGASHVKDGTDCQDRFKWKLLGDSSILVVVVSDGAGSTAFGGEGAEIACETFIEQLENLLDSSETNGIESISEEFGRLWVEHFQHLAIGKSVTHEVNIREFSCTFSAAIVSQNKAKFFQIGDGRILFTRDQKLVVGIEMEESEYVNMTSFLTDEDAVDQIEYFETDEKIDDLILFTDGIESVAIDFATGKPYEPFLLPMLAPLKNGTNGRDLSGKLSEFLSSPAINEKTDDDKTLVLASRSNV